MRSYRSKIRPIFRNQTKLTEFYQISDETLDIFPYDIRFTIGAEEIEPAASTVKLQFVFKEAVKVEKEEDISVVHLPNGADPEVVADNVAEGGAVEKFEVELSSLSPVVLTKTNVPG